MSAEPISARMRAAVRSRAKGCCEYCRMAESQVFVPHEPDHIIADQNAPERVLARYAAMQLTFKGKAP